MISRTLFSFLITTTSSSPRSGDAVVVEEAAAAAGCPHCTQKFLETNLPQHHTSTAAADPPHVLQNLSPIIIFDIVLLHIVNNSGNAIPLLAERLVHLHPYFSNLIRFGTGPSSWSSSSRAAADAASTLHAFSGAPTLRKQQLTGICKLVFESFNDQLSFQVITSILDSSVNLHNIVWAIEYDHSTYSLLPRLNSTSKVKLTETRI